MIEAPDDLANVYTAEEQHYYVTNELQPLLDLYIALYPVDR